MIPRIVLTGGPRGGKTTAVKHLQEQLPVVGIVPIIVPELATLLHSSGIRWLDIASSEQRAYQFQTNMIQQQIANEDLFYSFAHLVPGRKVIICDRGTVDNMAYARDDWHEDILSQVGSLGYLKRRYDAIIHLESSAWGDTYTTEDNEARYESKTQAQTMDTRTMKMWERGPVVPHHIIQHTVSLEAKLDAILRTVISVVTSHSSFE